MGSGGGAVWVVGCVNVTCGLLGVAVRVEVAGGVREQGTALVFVQLYFSFSFFLTFQLHH